VSRFDPARLIAASYPFITEVQTRFQDVDMLGHINNVAMAALFEYGRGKFNWSFVGEHGRRSNPGVRWLIARADISYLAEAHFPANVDVASAIGRVGNSSWTIFSAAFQQERCVALCDTVIVYTNADGTSPLPDALREKLSERLFPEG
jgi:acyl-CoA thioester hydrolase